MRSLLILTFERLFKLTSRSDTQLSRIASNVSSPDHSDEERFNYPDTESEEDVFLYPATTDESTARGSHPLAQVTSTLETEYGQDIEIPVPDPKELVHQVASSVSPPAVQSQPHPSPAQLEALSAAASSGDLSLLKKLFQTALQAGDLEAFALANDASSRTGFTALHAAASRGYLDIVKWRESLPSFYLISTQPQLTVISVIEDCGAIPDLEDREGEVGQDPRSLHTLTRLQDCLAQSRSSWPPTNHHISAAG